MESMKNAMKNAPQWGASLIMHVLVLAILAIFSIDTIRKPKIRNVVTELNEIENEDFQEELNRSNRGGWLDRPGDRVDDQSSGWLAA